MWGPKGLNDILFYYLYLILKAMDHRKPGGEARSQEAEAQENNGKVWRQHRAPAALHLK